VFTKIFSVPYYGLDMNDKLKTGLLLQFFQEAAAAHAQSFGVGVSDLLRRSLTWVLRRYRVKIHSLPGLGDLTVRTWFEPRRNLLSVRLFDILDGDGNVFADAWSGWVVVDLERGRPVRLDRALPQAYYDNAERVEPGEIEDLEKRKDGFDLERSFRVRWQELDLNGHTNHTVYFDWALESVPDDVLQYYSPIQLDAEYLTSARRTDVTVRTAKICDAPLKFSHVVLINDSGVVSARLCTTWGKIGE
jgi:acyl-ACP thioesterase